jgi:hypothetical protein
MKGEWRIGKDFEWNAVGQWDPSGWKAENSEQLTFFTTFWTDASRAVNQAVTAAPTCSGHVIKLYMYMYQSIAVTSYQDLCEFDTRQYNLAQH